MKVVLPPNIGTAKAEAPAAIATANGERFFTCVFEGHQARLPKSMPAAVDSRTTTNT